MSIDTRELRRALGAFATGVAVITTRTAETEVAGLTVNSFSSVSLAPPLVLWSLAHTAASYDAFARATHFAVNILAEQQTHLAERFAQSGGDKFSGLALREGEGGVPLIDGAVAHFCCRVAARHAGGDHVIMIGEVLSFAHTAQPPLLYLRGRYRQLRDDAAPPRDVISMARSK